MASIKTLQHGFVDTKLSGDVAAWCPAAQYHDYFVLGCYYQQDGVREGLILLFKYATGTATQIQAVPTRAVLDLKWLERDLLVATAEGTEHWRLMDGPDTLPGPTNTLPGPTVTQPAHLALQQRWPLDSLALYLTLQARSVAVSTEQGGLVVRDLDQGTVTWQAPHAHAYSAWTVQWTANPAVLVSGGDDCALRVWDVRTAAPALSNTKHYAMGVTEITCLPWAHTLAVGSYDESLALWDLRSLRQPSQTHALGGGVWRIKHVANSSLPGASAVPADALVLAVGCAANHFQLAGLTAAGQLLHLAEHQHKALQATPQDTLAYGIDWCRSQPDLFATCSFYDKIYSVWQATSANGIATTQND